MAWDDWDQGAKSRWFFEGPVATVDYLNAEVIRLRAALEKYAVAIMEAISCEDGLDGLEGTRLLEETEAGQALLDIAADMPVT